MEKEEIDWIGLGMILCMVLLGILVVTVVVLVSNGVM